MIQNETCIATLDSFFDLSNPYGYQYDIEEIAHALSNICRYTGHVHRFYSVAEHCVLVSKIVPPKYAMEGLLHDASEAFCGDVSSPLKAMLPEYQKIEDRVQQALAYYYELAYPLPIQVHKADKEMYWAERQGISKAKVIDEIWNQDASIATITPTGWRPELAKKKFLERYQEIRNRNAIEDKELACAFAGIADQDVG